MQKSNLLPKINLSSAIHRTERGIFLLELIAHTVAAQFTGRSRGFRPVNARLFQRDRIQFHLAQDTALDGLRQRQAVGALRIKPMQKIGIGIKRLCLVLEAVEDGAVDQRRV